MTDADLQLHGRRRISGGFCSGGQLVSRGTPARHFQRRPDLMQRVSRLLQPGADLPSDAYYYILGAPNSLSQP